MWWSAVRAWALAWGKREQGIKSAMFVAIRMPACSVHACVRDDAPQLRFVCLCVGGRRLSVYRISLMQ